MLDGKTILSVTKCGDLFSNDKTKVRIEFIDLAKHYHPDVNKDPLADAIFAKINELYNRALKLIDNGEWEVSNVIEFTSSSGEKLSFKYLRERKFELGRMYICDRSLIYILSSENEKYYRNFLAQVTKIRYADSKMEKEMSRFMPQVRKTFKTNKGEYCIILSKTEDVYSLQDLLDFYNGKIEDRHVAWIVSRLSNICCYLEYIGIAHNGISLDNCFVSPEYHAILLLGGWWYARSIGEPMIGTQKQIFNIMSVRDKSSKISSTTTDLESTKQVGRQCIDRSISSLNEFQKKTSIPKPMLDFLFSGSNTKSSQEFSKWGKALNESYGERKFIKMQISNKDIYK